MWQRGSENAPISVHLPQFTGQDLGIETVYPRSLASWDVSWDRPTGVLTLGPADPGPSARLFRLVLA